jgi:AcrR family transcriptional regulator
VTTTETGGKREQRKRQTRRDLETVAVELFTQRGYDNVTIDEIVAGANTSKRTFYRYYTAKEDVLMTQQHHLLALIPDAVAARPAHEHLIDAVCNAMRDVQPQIEPDDSLALEKARLIFETPSLASRMVEWAQAWEVALAETIAQRLAMTDRDDARPQMLAAAILAALRVVTRRWLTHHARTDYVDEAHRQLTALHTALIEL